jgi:hypothetical protein
MHNTWSLAKMGYFFSKDEASKNGDPPPLLPLPENHQESAVAENDDESAAAAAETNVSPVYGSPVLLPSMQPGLDLKLEQQEEEVECGDSQEQELQPPLLTIEQAQPPSPGAAATAEAAATSDTAKHDSTRELGGVLSAENGATVASQRVPTREGIHPGEGSTKIPGTQRLARDSGTREFYGAIVKQAADPQSRKVKLNRPGITKSGRKWKPMKLKR